MPNSRPPSWPTAIAAICSGTDNQGRDLLSAMLYGARVSIAIGGGAVLLAATRRRPSRPSRGLFRRQGRCADHAHRRRDPELPHDPARPAGERHRTRRCFPQAATAEWAPLILICAIAIHEWVQYARTVRAATMVETAKDYVKAAKVIGLPSRRIMLATHPSQRDEPGAGHRHHQSRGGRADGGDVVVPRRRNAAHLSVPRNADPHRKRVRVLGHLVDRPLPGIDPRAARPRGQRRRRLAPRSLQSQTAGADDDRSQACRFSRSTTSGSNIPSPTALSSRPSRMPR